MNAIKLSQIQQVRDRLWFIYSVNKPCLTLLFHPDSSQTQRNDKALVHLPSKIQKASWAGLLFPNINHIDIQGLKDGLLLNYLTSRIPKHNGITWG